MPIYYTVSEVEAISDSGWIFVGWSDGSTDNPRTDTNVSEDISVTAIFNKINYNVSGWLSCCFELTCIDVDSWYGEIYSTTWQVTNQNGIGVVFDSDSSRAYHAWDSVWYECNGNLWSMGEHAGGSPGLWVGQTRTFHDYGRQNEYGESYIGESNRFTGHK